MEKKGRVMCDDEVSYDADRLPSRDETRMLYDSVGWAAYTDDLDALIRGLENSAVVVTARSGGKLIGLARIVSDRPPSPTCRTFSSIPPSSVAESRRRSLTGPSLPSVGCASTCS